MPSTMAAAQRNMMRYAGPPIKRSASMMGYNQQMMGGSPMTPEPPGGQFSPFGHGGIGKGGPFPPVYNGPNQFGPNMGGMGMTGSMTGNMGMPPQYNQMNNMNNTMGNMMGQPGNIQPMTNQRRPSTLQYQPQPSAVPPPQSPNTPANNNRYGMSIDTPTPGSMADVKPQIAGPPQPMKNIVPSPVPPADIKPIISTFVT